jgi:hypothetical protein
MILARMLCLALDGIHVCHVLDDIHVLDVSMSCHVLDAMNACHVLDEMKASHVLDACVSLRHACHVMQACHALDEQLCFFFRASRRAPRRRGYIRAPRRERAETRLGVCMRASMSCPLSTSRALFL